MPKSLESYLYYQDDAVRIYHGDCREIGPLLPKACVDLLVQDPPYGYGKEKIGVTNDNLYDDCLDRFLMECWQSTRSSLKANASVYIFGTPQGLWRLWWRGGLHASERLTFRNEIVWDKGDGGFGVRTESQRCYFPQERCLFFMLGEQGFNTNADNYWEGWEPIRSVLEADCKKMGWGPTDIDRICGVGMYSHWFTRSQWCFIPEDHYRKLQHAAKGLGGFMQRHRVFEKRYEAFKQDYEELKRVYYATRAYFDNHHDAMTDVWRFPTVVGHDRMQHPTPKPIAMISRMVLSSCPVGGTVLDPFMGSGTTLRAAKELGRKAIGIEIEEKYCEIAAKRMRQGVLLPSARVNVKQSRFFAEPVRAKGRRLGKPKGP